MYTMLRRLNCTQIDPGSRIHERTISVVLLGIIVRVLRLQVSEYNVYITNQFQTTFFRGGGGGVGKMGL